MSSEQLPEQLCEQLCEQEHAVWRQKLSHVCWIGGPTDAGKTTVAEKLAARFDVAVYHQDRNEMDHLRRADPVRHPRHVAMRKRLEEQDEATFFEQGWLGRMVAEMAVDSRANWAERMDLVCEDLAAFPAGRPIVAEGPGFYPDVILPLLTGPRQAVWLIPSESFKRASHARRGKSAWRNQTSDPEQALRNHIERDLLLVRMYRDDLAANGLLWLEIDGSQEIDTVAQQVADRFGDLLLAT